MNIAPILQLDIIWCGAGPDLNAALYKYLSSSIHLVLLWILQVALLSVEVSSSREENDRLRAMAEVHEPNEQLQSAIRDRDEAIAK